MLKRILTCLLLALTLQVSVFPSASARAQDGAQARRSEQLRGARAETARAARMNFVELERQESLNPDDAYAVPRAIPAPKPAPEEPPGPEGSEPSAPSQPDTIPQPLGPSPAAQGFLASEDGVNDNLRKIPPDTHGAVGPAHLVVTNNGRVRVQTKTGTTVSTVGLYTFWSRLFPGRPISSFDIFDPKVLFDPYGGRFMITSCADRGGPNSAVLVGVTETSDPTGNWFLYSVDADPSDAVWADFPSMGFNKNWVVVQMNMFANGSGSSNFGRFFVFDKAQLYAGPPSAAVTMITVATSGSTMVPATTYDPNLETLYVVQRWAGSNGTLRVSAINNVGGSPVLVTQLSFPQAAGFTWLNAGSGLTDFAPQKDSPQKIQTNDDRLQSVVYRNGSLWAVHTIFIPRGGPVRSTVQWWEIDPNVNSGLAAAPRQRGLVDPTGTDWYAFPSISVNKNNDVLLGYSRFGPNQYASANYSFRSASDPANTLRDDAVLKAGEAHYYKTFGGTENRWGDYSATTVDPSNDTDLWTIQEYAAARGSGADNPNNDSRWGTWWGKIELAQPPPPQGTVSFALAAAAVGEDAGRVDVTVTRTGATSGAASVDFTTADVTASERKDYTAALGTLRFGANETAKTFSVLLTDDRFVEAPETFQISLGNPVGCTLGAVPLMTVSILSADTTNGPNPVDWSSSFDPRFFVRQHYLDFLNREPDQAGLDFWTGRITQCGADVQCAERNRVNVSAAFFLSIEFQETGYLVYRMHKAAYGNLPGASVPVRIQDFLLDSRQVGEGVQVGIGNWSQHLEANKNAYAAEFVARSRFNALYGLATDAQFVDQLNANAGGALSQAERDFLAGELAGGRLTRGQVLRAVAEDADFAAAEKSRAFVMMQYMGYLRRDPDEGGYLFWLGRLNQFGGNYVQAELVKAFIISIEYKERFAP